MWCANLMAYPIKKENFESVMLEAATRFGDSPYVATTDDGKVVGFVERQTELNAFRFKDESWGRCNMIIRK